MLRLITALTCAFLMSFSAPVFAQSQSAIGEAAQGMPLRAVGPAMFGGRISDIAIHPTNKSIWYVSAGSGGVWKTENAGTTFTPIFDNEASYSIGSVAIDPNNPDTIWVGTGENVSGRHVAWGSGVYKSTNGGKSWQNMGLGRSEHIGKIMIDPRDSNVIFVAAEGPLWAAGGDRGLYKSTNGGQSWTKVLNVDADTGVTDVEFNAANPSEMYAATYQRRRHVWSLLAGGPGSGIYKSTDNGNSWQKVEMGLPKSDMGKIGLAVTPADPNIVYATIEAKPEEAGFYRSLDRAGSFEKRNSYISGGTGPHYYMELTASPTDPDLVYQMDVFIHVTRDGGATFDYLGTGREKHSDNHAIWVDPDNGNHMLAGTDAGLYETFDEGTTWRHFANLPISQFYKVAVDNVEPFYNILGGAQDLGTVHGPSRTTHTEGVRNADWFIPTGADGYGVAFDPVEPDIMYMEFQVGFLFRYDKRSGEALVIQPQAYPGDAPERFNWDAPILISPHNSSRVYFGSQRLWRSDNRGDEWTAVSADLTRNINRYELEMGDRVWSVDDLYDNGAMSQYSTLTTITESPLVEGLLYTGSDDGLIQVSGDGGNTWNRARNLPGVPDDAFINDMQASLFDADTVFAAADAHKEGDFKPYLFISENRGRSWRSITGDLPSETIVWAIQQDHVNPNLLFIGTEYGLYFSTNRGTNWHKMAGAPTIAFRDVTIHRGDNDIIGATFGRGFYILDDYAPLRAISDNGLANNGQIYPVRDAWWYVPYQPYQALEGPTLGSTDFDAPNPDFGATITYHIADVPKSMEDRRHENERALRAEGEDIPFPGWDRLREESREGDARVLLLVRDANGDPVRWLAGASSDGVHRVTWDLRYSAPNAIDLTPPGFTPPWVTPPQGPLAGPGDYSVQLYVISDAGVEERGAPQTFTVKPVPTAPAGTDFAAVVAFQKDTASVFRRAAIAADEIGRLNGVLTHMRAAAVEAPNLDPSMFGKLNMFGNKLAELSEALLGDRVRSSKNEATVNSVFGKVGLVSAHWGTRQTPTATFERELASAKEGMASIEQQLADLIANDFAQLEADLDAAGAPSWK